jgi:GAF domain-containing protein
MLVFMYHFDEDLLLSLNIQLLQSDVNAMLDSDKDLKEILDQILHWIEDESKNDILTSILLYNKETNQLFTGAAPSLPDRYNKVISGLNAGPVAGSCGTAAFYGKQVIVEDIETDPLWENYKSYALPEGLHSCWSTPIFGADKDVLGTFAIYYKEPRKPTEHDLQLIDEIVDLTATAIETREEDFKKIVGL